TMGIGKCTKFNSPGARAFWHPGTPIGILVLGFFLLASGLGVCLVPWLIFLAPIIWIFFYSPTRLRLPRSFFADGAEAFSEAHHVHKAAKAEEITLLGYVGSYFSR